MSSLAMSLLEAGNALAEHREIIEEVIKTARSGVSKESIIGVLKKAQEEISDSAITEELTAAEERKKNLGF